MPDVFDEGMDRFDQGAAHASPDGQGLVPDECIPDDLVDAMLDGEVEPGEHISVLARIASDDAALERLQSTRDILNELARADREDGCPDFTRAILTRVARERGLLSRLGLRRVMTYRYAAAATIALAMSGLFLAQRVAPGSFGESVQPAVLSGVASAVPAETADVVSSVRSALGSIRQLMPGSENLRPRTVVRSAGYREWVPEQMNPPVAAVLWADDGPTVQVRRSEVDRSLEPSCTWQSLRSEEFVSLRSSLIDADQASSIERSVAYSRSGR
ncbi:MAG: hypothetical protein SFZ24_10650 [Planctomycetota bacterium]|nr:hypothetical protein [Planctomycetota bacterium]